MAIPSTEEVATTSKFSAALQGIDEMPAPPLRAVARVPRWLKLGLVLAIVVGTGYAAAFVNRDLLLPAPTASQVLTEEVRRTDMIVSITEDGTVESSHNVDIKCEVQGGSTILWIIPDGTAGQERRRTGAHGLLGH